MSNLPVHSPIFWQGLRAILTGTSLKALQYNKLVFLASESLSVDSPEKLPELQYALLDSPVELRQGALYSWLREHTERALSDGQLTGTQRALAMVTVQKMKALDLPLEIKL